VENKDRQKLLIIVLAVAVGLIIGNSVVYKPLMAAWESRQAQIKKLKDQVGQDQDLVRRKNHILGRWKYMQDNSLTNNFSQAQAGLLKALLRWGQSSQVTTDNTTAEDRQDAEEESGVMIHTIECHTDATGTMRGLQNFLTAIEDEKMGLKLENIEFAMKDNSGQQLTMSLTISALILDPSQSATGTAQPSKPKESD
jgi:hypothetical protein